MKRLLYLLFVIMAMSSSAMANVTGGEATPTVKVIHAEGKIFYHEIFISWSTEYEKSACEFIIEASENAKDWRIRGRMKSKGTANSHAEYNFVDTKEERFRYYRIRKSDRRTGMETLSEFGLDNYSIVVTLDEVVIDHEKKLLIEYSVDQDQELIVRVYNRIGEQVVTKVMPFNQAGEYLYQLDISTLKKDNYLLVVTQALLDKAVAEKAFQVKN